MKAQRSLEEKVQSVLAGLKGQGSIAELCRRFTARAVREALL